MKKMIALAVALMLIPVGAFALEAITDSEMEAVTGQTGVSIAVDDVKIYQHIDYLTYTDDDGILNLDMTIPGFVAGGTGGYVGITDLAAIMHMNALTNTTYNTGVDTWVSTFGADGLPGTLDDTLTSDDTFTIATSSPSRPLQGTYVNGYDISNYDSDADTFEEAMIAKALSIDVGVVPVLTEGVTFNAALPGIGAILAGLPTPPVTTNVVGVQIGLPTLEICTSALEFDIAVYDVDTVLPAAQSANHAVSMGGIKIGGMTMTTLDGEIEIAAHSFSW